MVRFSATYLPATEEAKIGGDWYEAFELPGDRVLLDAVYRMHTRATSCREKSCCGRPSNPRRRHRRATSPRQSASDAAFRREDGGWCGDL